jgi:hypothetical protein
MLRSPISFAMRNYTLYNIGQTQIIPKLFILNGLMFVQELLQPPHALSDEKMLNPSGTLATGCLTCKKAIDISR